MLIGELQNPPSLYKTMLYEGDMNNPACRSDAFLHSSGLQLATQHCMTGGGGLVLPLLTQIGKGHGKS